MEMIKHDLTEVLNKYGEWDEVIRDKYLSYVSRLIDQQQVILYRNNEYRNLEDLVVDLNADLGRDLQSE